MNDQIRSDQIASGRVQVKRWWVGIGLGCGRGGKGEEEEMMVALSEWQVGREGNERSADGKFSCE